MDAGRPKKKRSELELLLGNGDAGGFAPFSPRLPILSVSSPALAEAAAESDEQLARRLHEELNGTRMTRRGSRAVTEETMPLSPTARAVASPHAKPKADTPRAHGGPGRSSLPSLPSVSESAPDAAAGGGGGRSGEAGAVTEATTADAGSVAVPTSGSGSGMGANTQAGAATGAGTAAGQAPGPTSEGAGEAVKRKRNSVPARELHLLLQQAASSAGRNESALSPTRSNRGGVFASGRVDAAASGGEAQQQPSTGQTQGSQALPRRDADRSGSQHGQQAHQGQQPQHLPAGSAVSAPMAAPTSPRAPLPPPCPPSLLPPKLKQRYLAGLSSLHQPTLGSVSASVSNVGSRAEGAAAASAAGPGPTTVTPSCVLGGARNSLLSGHSAEGSSARSHTQSRTQSHSPSWARDGSRTGATYGGPEPLSGAAAAAAAASVASLAGATPRPQAATGATAASVGGCSSTDETETDNDNSGAAAATGAADGGPSATSPKAPPAPSLPQQPLPATGSASQRQRQAPANDGITQEQVGNDTRSSQGKQECQQGCGGAAPAEEAPAEPPSASAHGKQSHSGPGALKVPKLPMIRAGRGWYRGRLMRESVDGQRVLVDVPGAPNPLADGSSGSGDQQHQHFWLPAASDRIWRGSYKGKDWKYLGDGAWEPKPAAFKRGKLGSSSNGLPLPQWAVDGGAVAAAVGPEGGETEVRQQQQPSSSFGGANAATATVGASCEGDAAPAGGKQRSKRERSGWSSLDDTSDDADEQQERKQRAAPDAPNGRSGQRSHRHSSPPVTTVAAAAAGGGAASASVLASAVAVKSGAVPATPAPAAGDEQGCNAPAATGVEVADVAAGEAATAADPVQLERSTAAVAADDDVGAGCDGFKPAPRAAAATEVSVSDMPSAAEATRGPRVSETAAAPADEPEDRVDGPPARPSQDGGAGAGGGGISTDSDTAAVAAAVGGAATTAADASVKPEQPKDVLVCVGSAQVQVAVADEDEDDGEVKWVPGVPYPRVWRPRRARRRQQRVATPFDGMQFPLPHHHHAHNPYAFYPGLSGEESGGDGDTSDPEHGGGLGGRRGSDANGDGTAAPHHGSRRRAAARAAAVAAAAARAEAEAEEEEQEEILMGRRPPRRDKFGAQHAHHGGGANRRSSHHRSRSGARSDYYMYGDSSGNLDDPYTVDAAAHGNASSARPRAGSRGNSQPAPEYGLGSSGAWETAQWQTAGGHAGDGIGAGQAPQQPRNRRKGKPSRSRMDGEGDVWCCWEDDWELEAAGGAWARMPEVLRRLYYAPCPAADGSGGTSRGTAGQGSSAGATADLCQAALHRQSGGGAYFGALQAPNKRRRVYEEDPAVSPDDLDLEVEVDDHEHDADYLPPYGGSGASRRSSGFGGGRRCSANGGGATKRQRSGDAALPLQYSSSYFQQHQMGQYGDTTAPPIRQRILVSCGWAGMDVGIATMTHGSNGNGFIPSGLAGLLEAALGHDATTPAGADASAIVQHDGVAGARDAGEVKKEPGFEASSGASALALGSSEAMDIAAAALGGLRSQCVPPAALPGDPLGAHVALSDSSATPSGAEEGKYGVAAAATVIAAGTAADASGLAACADGAAMALLQQRQHQQYGGSSSGGGAVAGGSPTPPGSQAGQLRPNTPTRAKRTGRPPSAVLGAGAPLPKLPALSSTASLRLQMAGLAGPLGLQPAPPASVADGQLAGGPAAVATATDALLSPRVSLGPDAHIRGEEAGARPMGQGGFHGLSAGGVEGPRGDAVCSMWHAVAGSGTGGAASMGQAGQLGAGMGSTNPADDGRDVAMPDEAACNGQGASVFATAAAAAAAGVSFDCAASLAAKHGDGGAAAEGASCCVMDAIGALLHDKQPAMQQLAMRAQLELDSIGLVLASQQQQYGAAGLQQDDDVQPQLHQRLMSSGRAGSNGRGTAGPMRSGSTSAAMSPAAPDPLIASLPSVEVVVSLFSARASYGSAQQALADLVGGAAALPLFQ